MPLAKPGPARRWKTVKAQIEATPQIAELEAHWFKSPREEMREAMIVRKPDTVSPDYSKFGEMAIHSHPKYIKPSMPSLQDLFYFINLGSRAMVVAAITPEGKVAGYTMVTKPSAGRDEKIRLASRLKYSKEMQEYEASNARVKEIRAELSRLKAQGAKADVKRVGELYSEWRKHGDAMTNALHSAMKLLGWKARFVPMPGYVFRNGYYLPKPKPPPKGGASVSVSEAEEARLKKKKAEEERRRRILLNQQPRNRLRN